MNYGRAVRVVRAARNLSQTDLAARAGVDPSYISLIEKGERNPSVSKLHALSRALEVPGALLTLLASERRDLNNIDASTAGVLGMQLLRLLMDAEEDQETE